MNAAQKQLQAVTEMTVMDYIGMHKLTEKQVEAALNAVLKSNAWRAPVEPEEK